MFWLYLLGKIIILFTITFLIMTNEKSKRRIESVLDIKSGEEIFASEFFTQEDRIIFQQRGLLELAIQNKEPKFVCYYCKQYVKISGGNGNYKNRNAPILHFAHLKDSEDCHIKTNTKLTREEIRCIKYNGAKESDLHDNLKSFIHERLQENENSNKGISNPKKEKWYRDLAISKQWKQPDIQSIYFDKKLVFEIQLSTTFLDVIVSRQYFYQERKTFIMWIFHKFNPEEDTLRFMEKDIIYTNNLNAFVFDSEAKKESTKKNDLVLKCYYAFPVRAGEKIEFEWRNEFVTLDNLTFRSNDYKVFYYDSESEFENLEIALKTEIEKKKLEEEIKIQELERIQEEKEKKERDEYWEKYHKEKEQAYNNISPLQNYFRFPSKTIKQDIAVHFLKGNFNHKYWLEEEFLKRIYRENIETDDKDYLDAIVYAFYFLKAKNIDLMRKITRVQQPLNILFSLKMNKVFGYNYSKMLQVIHQAIPQYQKFGNLFITALEVYNQLPELIKSDANGKLQTKLEKYKINPPVQNHEYDDLFKTIFPELFKNK